MASYSESVSELASLVTGRPDHLMLFRRYVSRIAGQKGRAVLEKLGLNAFTCFDNYPFNKREQAVQEGLIDWCDGKGIQPPTWGLLVEAMEYARVAQYHVQALKWELGSSDSVPAKAPPDALSREVTDHPHHIMLLRRYVSRRAAGNGRAVLEGVGLDAPTIATCFSAHPMNEEEAVQVGLIRWCGGQAFKPSTWRVLVQAMQYALIDQQAVQGLKERLGLSESSREKEREWHSAYQESLSKHSSVSVEVIRTIFIGPTESGKSTLKHLLVHNKPKAAETSTGVMDTPEVVTKHFSPEQYVVGESTSAWQLVDSDVMKKALHACIAHQAYKKKNRYPAEVNVKGTGQHEVEQMDDSPLPEWLDTEQDQSDVALLDKQFSLLLEDIEAEGKHLQSKEGEEGKRIKLTDAVFIHLLDTGGQPSFQDVLPLLLDVPCTYVQVFNAALALDERVPISYRSNDNTRVSVEEGAESCRDTMLRSFSSMQTMAHKRSKQLASFLQKYSPEPQLRIFVVGTHKDQLIKEGRLDEATQDITAFLEGLEGKPYCVSIESDSSAKQPFFLVNAMADENDQASVNSLRECLSNEGSRLKLDIPVMWFICQEITRRCTEKKFFRLQDLETFCRKHGFIEGENAASQFRALLQLFSLLGFYSFFNLEGVPDKDNFVCTDTGVFLKEVSKLLAVQFTDTTSGRMKNFKNHGILADTPELFKVLEMNPHIDQKWFLEALQHLGIAACLHGKDRPQYFIPAALSQKSAVLHPQCSVEPLCFTYEMDGFFSLYDMPRGVFCRLVVELIQNEWKPFKDDCSRSLLKFQEPQQQFNIFLEDCTGYIRIIPQALVEFSSPKELHTACKSLCHDVERCLSTSTANVVGSEFSSKAKLITGFKCLCKKEEDVCHLAIPAKHGQFLKCSSSQKDLPGYTKRQHIWFSSVEGVELKQRRDPDNPDSIGIWVLEECTATHNADSPQNDDSILSQIVHDRKDHLMLFRSYVSSKAAGKANAVLEGVGLNTPTIKACFTAHPLNDEEIVQDGLTRWSGGEGTQSPTWGVLISAMKYAKIDQQDIEGLKTALNQPAVTEAFATPRPPQPTPQPPQGTPWPPQGTPQPPQPTPRPPQGTPWPPQPTPQPPQPPPDQDSVPVKAQPDALSQMVTDLIGGQPQPLQFGGQTQPLQFGGQTQPLQFGGQPQPLQVGGQTQPLQFGGQPQPLQVGGQTQALQMGGQPQPLQVGGQPQPLQTGGQPLPLQMGGQPQPLQFGGQPQPLQTGGQPQPLQVGGRPQPLKTGRQPLPLQMGGQPQPLQFGGQPQPLQFGGQPQPLQFGGQPQPLQMGGQPQALQKMQTQQDIAALTNAVLIEAIEFAQFDQQDIEGLRKDLGLSVLSAESSWEKERAFATPQPPQPTPQASQPTLQPPQPTPWPPQPTLQPPQPTPWPPQPTPQPPQPTSQSPQPAPQPPQPTLDQEGTAPIQHTSHSQYTPDEKASHVLGLFRGRFIREVESKDIVHDLQVENIIPDGVLRDVNKESDKTLQNKKLYAHLEQTSTKDSLMAACNIMIAVSGNPLMKKFGEDLKKHLMEGLP